MKVCLINTFDQFGGAAIAAQRLAQALVKNGVEATLLVDKKEGTSNFVKQVTELPYHKLFHKIRFALDRIYFTFFEKNKSARFAFSSANIGIDISSNKYIVEADIIHLHWINFGFLSLNTLEKLFDLQKPIVITMHDMWWYTGGCHFAGPCTNYIKSCGDCQNFLAQPHSNDLSKITFQKKVNLYKNKNITFVGCSEWMVKGAQMNKYLVGKNFVNIPNAININLFTPIDSLPLFSKYNLDNSKTYLLFGASNISDIRKGFKYLKEALKILENMYPDIINKVELLVFGKATREDFKDIQFKTNYVGSISQNIQMVELYNMATVFICPSIEDNLPNTIMEAMACGTAVVSFATGGIPEMIDHLKTGYLAAKISAEELAKGIYTTVFELDLKHLKNNARAKTIEQYSETVVAQKYQALYQDLIK